MARRKTKTSTGLSNPKAKVNVSITPQSKSTLEKIISQTELTKSAFFEGILNGSISLSSQEAEKLINLKFDRASEEAENEKRLEVEIIDDSNREESDTSQTNDRAETQQETISELEGKLEQTQSNLQEKDRENESLQTKLAEISLLTESLKKDLEGAKDTSKNIHQQLGDLQKSNEEKQLEIDRLNQEIDRLKEEKANKQNEETSSVDKSAQLIREIESKDNLIARLEQQNDSQNEQIRQLQTRANQMTANHNQSFANLQKTNQEQQNKINLLEKKITELESVASIGSQTLNKWRSKIYRE